MNCPPADQNDAGVVAYQAALNYLYNFVNYERKMTEVYAPEKMDPFRPAHLLRYLGNPQEAFAAIHVAGSKGKGSVAAMCASCLRAAGLNVGLYTSPHLQEFRERIRILTPDDPDGRVPRSSLITLVEALKEVTPQVPGLTWFELVTALAFMHFAREAVDVAVVEVGLGGRLDATNVLTPLVSVITSLSLEHTALLGNSLAEIAAEKGGIIKQGVPVVVAPQAPQALARLEEIARQREAPLVLVGEQWQYTARPGNEQILQQVTVTESAHPDFVPAGTSLEVGLMGGHQQENAVVAVAALAESAPHLPTLDVAAVRRGLATVHWPGRLERLHQGAHTPTLLLDGAHTAASAGRLAEALRELFVYDRLWLVVGATGDKDIEGILEPLLPLAAGLFFTRADHPRAAPSEVVASHAAGLGYQGVITPDVATAVAAAWQAASPADLICVTGSMFVIGDLLNCWESLKSKLL